MIDDSETISFFYNREIFRVVINLLLYIAGRGNRVEYKVENYFKGLRSPFPPNA